MRVRIDEARRHNLAARVDHAPRRDRQVPADRADPIEVWGTRIGRTLGLLLTLGLMAWLVLYVIRGS